jgi:hypothetical protein
LLKRVETFDMGSEKYNLSWNEFENCASNSFKELLKEQEFADITLVSNDDIQLKAHKVILSSCSPVFKNLLLRNPHSHPLIYLSEINQNTLRALVQFMYTGQVEVEQMCLDEFLNMAQKFRIRGLEKNSNELENTLKPKVAQPAPIKRIHHEIDDRYMVSVNGIKEESSFGIVDTVDYEYEPKTSYSLAGEFACDLCSFIGKYNMALWRHKKRSHEAAYSCSQCTFEGSEKYTLIRHRRSVHGEL